MPKNLHQTTFETFKSWFKMAYLDKNVKITAQVKSSPSAAIFWLIIAKLLIEIVENFLDLYLLLIWAN